MTKPGSPQKPRRFRRRVLIAVAVVFGLAAFPGYFFVRYRFFPPTFDVVSIRAAAHYQDPALLVRAWELPVARTFGRSLTWQSNGSVCGPSSLANIERSFGTEATESLLLSGTGKCWTGICFGGLTLDELEAIVRAKTARRATLLRDLDYATFRAHLPRFNDPSRRYLVNFHRGLLFARGGGHHSPVGSYLEAEDLVFVLDVNSEYQPWLVDAKRLFDAVDSVDGSSGKKRGFLMLEN